LIYEYIRNSDECDIDTLGLFLNDHKTRTELSNNKQLNKYNDDILTKLYILGIVRPIYERMILNGKCFKTLIKNGYDYDICCLSKYESLMDYKDYQETRRMLINRELAKRNYNKAIKDIDEKYVTCFKTKPNTICELVKSYNFDNDKNKLEKLITISNRLFSFSNDKELLEKLNSYIESI
jgi:hypothetical protein